MYAYSSSANGPWLGEFKRPDLALGAGRAMYGGTVYVSSVREIVPSDGMVLSRVILGDCAETLAVKYGSGAADFLDIPGVKDHFDTLYEQMVSDFGGYVSKYAPPGIMAPVITRAYRPDRHVKAGDFST